MRRVTQNDIMFYLDILNARSKKHYAYYKDMNGYKIYNTEDNRDITKSMTKAEVYNALIILDNYLNAEKREA